MCLISFFVRSSCCCPAMPAPHPPSQPFPSHTMPAVQHPCTQYIPTPPISCLLAIHSTNPPARTHHNSSSLSTPHHRQSHLVTSAIAHDFSDIINFPAQQGVWQPVPFFTCGVSYVRFKAFSRRQLSLSL